VEGVNLGGFMLFGIALLLVGGTSVVALGLWIGRLMKAARIVFAAGLLCSAAIAAFATLTFLSSEFTHYGTDSSLIVLTALSLMLAGSGQFAAALQCPKVYAAAFACAAGSAAFLAAPMLSGDAGSQIPGVHALLALIGPVGMTVASLLFALASVAIAGLSWLHSSRHAHSVAG
jgi:hypothetical protein